MPKMEIRSGTPAGLKSGLAGSLAELLPQGGQVLPRLSLTQPPPQRRLPGLVIVRLRARDVLRLALVPGQDQVGPEHKVLVKQIGDLRGELETLAHIGRRPQGNASAG